MALMRQFKSNLLDMANWSKHHLAQLIILAGVIILFLVVCVLFSWFVGFYMNGFYGMKFDLGSVWQGLGACVTAISLANIMWILVIIHRRAKSPEAKGRFNNGKNILERWT